MASQLRPSLAVGFGGIQAVHTEFPYRVRIVDRGRVPYPSLPPPFPILRRERPKYFGDLSGCSSDLFLCREIEREREREREMAHVKGVVACFCLLSAFSKVPS